jgi:hypothetical protein
VDAPAPRFAAIDSEAPLIIPGCPAPDIVCGSWGGDDLESGVALADEFCDRVEQLLKSDYILVLANAAFDFAAIAQKRQDLLRAIFQAYRDKRVHDVLIAEGLNAIFRGHLGVDPRTGGSLRKPSTGQETKRYSLEVVADLVLGRVDAKALDEWRKSYWLLRGIPVHRWTDVPHHRAE